MTERPHYALLLRPVGVSTLPDGIEWSFTHLPWDSRRNDLPTHPSWRYGVFVTDRDFTDDEMTHFGIVKVL